MCGISGEIRFDGKAAGISLVAAAARHMQRRGPDGEGFLSFDRVALGHRRLKIFDLSVKGQQPMFDPALGLAIVFNGAIYNYRELRNELKSAGYTFFSTSDTEVLLKGWHRWGTDMLEKLEGMFAFCIWERDSGRLYLARDRMGVKPLYYVQTHACLRFASTLPALLDGADKAIDNEALHYYLMFHMVPEPLTLIKSVRKLEPGTVMTVEETGEIKKHSYWRLRFDSRSPGEQRSESEWLELLKDALVHAIKKRLVADVPVGILLSGGLDSSLLVALTAQATNMSPPTFSIGFESTPEEAGDEFHYSDMVAKRYSTDHHKIVVETPDFQKAVMESVEAMSEPMPSHDVVGFYLLSREVARHVKAVQSGQGADELFAGYHWFQDTDYLNISPHVAAEKLCGRLADNSYEEYLHMVMPDRRVGNLALSYMEELCTETRSRYMLDEVQQYESTGALANGPLARVDNMTMAWALEAREPFLDQALVDIACRLPAGLKLPQEGKYLLKQLARELLPAEVVDRPKGYFPVPRLKHPGDKEAAWLRDIMSPAAIRQQGLFNPACIRELLQAPGCHRTNLGASKLWQVGVLQCWMQTHNIQ